MDFWEGVVKKYPRYTIIVLIAYGVGVTLVSAYTFVRSSYLEAKKPYLSAIFTYCEGISDTVARIARSGEYPNKQVEDFWSYYLGKLILVEDKNLEGKMIAFGAKLDSINPSNYATEKDQLRRLALGVSGACRDLIKDSWSLSITPWDDLRKATN